MVTCVAFLGKLSRSHTSPQVHAVIAVFVSLYSIWGLLPS